MTFRCRRVELGAHVPKGDFAVEPLLRPLSSESGAIGLGHCLFRLIPGATCSCCTGLHCGSFCGELSVKRVIAVYMAAPAEQLPDSIFCRLAHVRRELTLVQQAADGIGEGRSVFRQLFSWSSHVD